MLGNRPVIGNREGAVSGTMAGHAREPALIGNREGAVINHHGEAMLGNRIIMGNHDRAMIGTRAMLGNRDGKP
jgi:hypothetical protein